MQICLLHLAVATKSSFGVTSLRSLWIKWVMNELLVCDFLAEVTNLHINVIQVSDQIVLLVVQMRCILAERGSLRSNEWKLRLMVWNRGSLAGLGSAHWSDSCMEDLYLCNYFRIQFCFLQCSEMMTMMMMVNINCALAKHQILF